MNYYFVNLAVGCLCNQKNMYNIFDKKKHRTKFIYKEHYNPQSYIIRTQNTQKNFVMPWKHFKPIFEPTIVTIPKYFLFDSVTIFACFPTTNQLLSLFLSLYFFVRKYLPFIVLID